MIWPKVVTLVSRTQPSGPLCLWQCFYLYWITGTIPAKHQSSLNCTLQSTNLTSAAICIFFCIFRICSFEFLNLHWLTGGTPVKHQFSLSCILYFLTFLFFMQYFFLECIFPSHLNQQVHNTCKAFFVWNFEFVFLYFWTKFCRNM